MVIEVVKRDQCGVEQVVENVASGVEIIRRDTPENSIFDGRINDLLVTEIGGCKVLTSPFTDSISESVAFKIKLGDRANDSDLANLVDDYLVINIADEDCYSFSFRELRDPPIELGKEQALDLIAALLHGQKIFFGGGDYLISAPEYNMGSNDSVAASAGIVDWLFNKLTMWEDGDTDSEDEDDEWEELDYEEDDE